MPQEKSRLGTDRSATITTTTGCSLSRSLLSQSNEPHYPEKFDNHHPLNSSFPFTISSSPLSAICCWYILSLFRSLSFVKSSSAFVCRESTPHPPSLNPCNAYTSLRDKLYNLSRRVAPPIPPICSVNLMPVTLEALAPITRITLPQILEPLEVFSEEEDLDSNNLRVQVRSAFDRVAAISFFICDFQFCCFHE